MPTAQQLAQGLKYHQSGELDAAERIYRAVLATAPKNADAWHLLGLVTLQTGNAEKAAEHIRSAIGVNANAAEYHCNLGIALCLLKRFDQAVASFQKAIRLNPSYAEAYNNLANAFRQQGKRDPAVDAWRRAVVLKPDYHEAWHNLGMYYREQGDIAAAVPCLREVIRLRPGAADACNNLAAALHQLGNLDEAVQFYRRAIELAPRFAPAYNNLANVLKEQRKVAEALECYRRALEINPTLAEALVGLAATQYDSGQSADAIANYQKAIALKPNLAPAICNLGIIHEERGDFVQAEQYFRTALRGDASFAPAYMELATVLRGRLPKEDLEAIKALLSGPGLDHERRAILHFALVQAFDSRGDYRAAAEHSLVANAVRVAQWHSTGQQYDRAAHNAFIDRTIAQFTPDYFARVRTWGDPSTRPVFIVGMPRAGTTLLEQVLAGHSQVFAAGELTLGRDGFEAAFGHAPSEARPEFDRARVERFAQAHLAELTKQDATAYRVVSKLPENYLYLGFLKSILPRASIIHCRRDPRDVALSCWLTNFRSVRWASDVEDVASRFREYERLMAHWRAVLPAPMLEVSYEETVNDLEGVARRILAWCGLEWEPRCLEFHRVQRPVQTASVVQVRQPIYGSSIGKWRRYAEPLKMLFASIGSG